MKKRERFIKMLVLASMLSVLTIMSVSFVRCAPYDRNLIDWRQTCYSETMWEYNPDISIVKDKIY